MNDTAQLLDSTYKGSHMGIQSIHKLLEKLEDEQAVVGELQSQLAEYEEINEETITMLHEAGEKEKDINPIAKVSSDVSVTVNTMIDRSNSHVAEMMMQGNAMGVIKIIKAMNEYSGADEPAKNIAHRLLDTEQSNFENMKKYL